MWELVKAPSVKWSSMQYVAQLGPPNVMGANGLVRSDQRSCFAAVLVKGGHFPTLCVDLDRYTAMQILQCW